MAKSDTPIEQSVLSLHLEYQEEKQWRSLTEDGGN